jgi:hypothetical protein
MDANLVPLDLSLSVVLEVTVSLDPALDQLSELGRKDLLVKEVVDSETGSGSLGRVSGSDASLGGTDATQSQHTRHERWVSFEFMRETMRCSGRGGDERWASELDLLEAVDDLVEVEDEVGSVRNEQSALAVETYTMRRQPNTTH